MLIKGSPDRNASRRQVLALGAGAMISMGLAAPSANAASDVVLAVTPIAQTRDWSCWAAAAAMLLTWQRGAPAYTELDVAHQAGPNFETAFTNDTGLLGTEFAAFASALGLIAEAPQNFTAEGYADLLSHGPLWVGASLQDPGGPRRHIRVLRGVTGLNDQGGPTAWVIDPDGGRAYSETLSQFAQEMETIARQEIKVGGTLFPQILHLP